MSSLRSTVFSFQQVRKSVAGSRKSLSKGLTLIEILVALAITIVAGTLLFVIIVNSAGLFSLQSSKLQGGLNINDALMEVRKSIKQASSVASSYTGGSTTYTSGVNQLVLKVSSVDSSNNIIANTYDHFVFFLDQKNFRFKIFPDPLSVRNAPDQVLSTVVDSLTFKYFNSAIPPVEVTPASAAKVYISLILKQKAGAGFDTNTATAEASLRND